MKKDVEPDTGSSASVQTYWPGAGGEGLARYATVEDGLPAWRVVSPQDSAAPLQCRRASLGTHRPERTAALIHYVTGDLESTFRVLQHHTRSPWPLGRGTNCVLSPRSGAVAVRHLGAEMCSCKTD
jgi:hypothetical protein